MSSLAPRLCVVFGCIGRHVVQKGTFSLKEKQNSVLVQKPKACFLMFLFLTLTLGHRR